MAPSLPTWIWDLEPLANHVRTLVGFAKNPLRFILGVLLPYVVAQITGIGKGVINSILSVAGGVGWALESAFGTVGTAIVTPFRVLTDTTITLHTAYLSAAAGLGPVAPAATILLYGIEIVVLLYVVDLIVRAGLLGALEGVPVVGVVASTAGQVYVATRDGLSRAWGWAT